MDTLIRFDPTEDEPSLAFDCGELPVDEVVMSKEMEPNGYFWEGVLRFTDPALSDGVDFDSEAGMFCVYGCASVLEQVRDLMEPYLTDPAKITSLIERAELEGFDLEDSEPEERTKSFFSRFLGRN
jgi:hypothetical protein